MVTVRTRDKSKNTNNYSVASALAGASDLQKRILFVLFALIIYRLGAVIPLPGINIDLLMQSKTLDSGVFSMFNMFSGGALKRMAIFALSLTPYITASILTQLASYGVPYLSNLRKEGGSKGQATINKYTMYLAVFISFLQGYLLAVGVQSQGWVLNPGEFFKFQTALTICCGTMFLVWLGDQITNRGIGNGVSVLIFAGIVVSLPSGIARTVTQINAGEISGMWVLGLSALFLSMLIFCIFMETSYRKIKVQYPKRQVGMNKMVGGDINHMPFKINMVGVIPVIFASSILGVPYTLAQLNPTSSWATFIGMYLGHNSIWYVLMFAALIIYFSFFYLDLTFNSKEKAERLKAEGGYIAGFRPGETTAKYFKWLSVRLTVIGALYLTIVCVVPILLGMFNTSVPFYLGGTSLLIAVSVSLDLVNRIQTHIIAQRYEVMMKKASLRNTPRGIK